MRTRVIEGLLLAVLAVVGIADGVASVNRKTFQTEFLSPGWYLVTVSIALLVCIIIYCVMEHKGDESKRDGRMFPTGTTPAVWVSTAVYAILIPLIGYALATFLFFATVFYLLGNRSWLRIGIEGLVFAIAFYLSFVNLARVLMPPGWLQVSLQHVF